MDKSLLTKIGVGFVILVLFFMAYSGYNSAIDKQEEVSSAWGQVQNAYQRRSDLVPNLVNTVKGAVSAEKEILTGVVEARAKATSIQVDPNKLTPENIKNFQGAQDGLSQALGKLLMITENYPQLQSIGGFTDLRAELAGTENRIATERRRFNEAVKDYNVQIRRFPFNLFANMLGFEKKGYFEAQAGSDKAPEVKF